MEKLNVIIDTDIGDDIDDAFALSLAMQSPELNILGVTTVFGDTLRRAKIAKRLLRLGACGHIPVRAGVGVPILNPTKFGREQDYSKKPQTYIDSTDEESLDSDQTALDFLYEQIMGSDDPISLITLGPLTNIGLLIATHREVVGKIERIIIMGGAFFMNFPEHNVVSDPEAAQIVFSSGIPITAVGLDVTFQCKLNDQQIKRLEGKDHPCLKFLMAMRRNWGGDVYLHDPLAVATAFDPTYVTLEKHLYMVEVQGVLARGFMVNVSDYNWGLSSKESTLHVARTVNDEAFIDMLMDRLDKYK